MLSECGESVTPHLKPWFHVECLLSMVQRRKKPRAVSKIGEVTAASLPHAETQEQVAMQFGNQGTRGNDVIGFPSSNKEGHGPVDGHEELWTI